MEARTGPVSLLTEASHSDIQLQRLGSNLFYTERERVSINIPNALAEDVEEALNETPATLIVNLNDFQPVLCLAKQHLQSQ